jgi:hypothetical protein
MQTVQGPSPEDRLQRKLNRFWSPPAFTRRQETTGERRGRKGSCALRSHGPAVLPKRLAQPLQDIFFLYWECWLLVE